MTNEKMQATARTWGAELRARHGRVGACPIADGFAFFRQPTADEYDEWRAMADTSEARKAYRAYVRGCFLGALVHGPDGEPVRLGPDAFEQIAGQEGPGWANGPAGDVVNTIAGMKARGQALFF